MRFQNSGGAGPNHSWLDVDPGGPGVVTIFHGGASDVVLTADQRRRLGQLLLGADADAVVAAAFPTVCPKCGEPVEEVI